MNSKILKGPSFVCIGAQKAATTWLYHNLSKHQEIGFPDRKEVHFWDANYDKGLNWYIQQYSSLNNSFKVTGDITPAYSILPKKKIAQVNQLNPNLKIIFIMRNPIERAWSLALMNFKQLQKIQWEKTVVELNDMNDSFFEKQINMQGSILRGDYCQIIKNWSIFFPNNQFKLMYFDALKENVDNFYHDVCSFLEVDAGKPLSTREKVFHSTDYPIRESLKLKLVSIYKPKIDELSELLNKDFSAWYKIYEN